MYELVLSILMSHLAADAVPQKQLAHEIVRVAAKYELNAVELTQLILVESRGRAAAYNPATDDYGLMQINGKTASSYNISYGCLTNWRCNLDAGARILSDFDRLCQYNVGTGTLKGPRLERCLKYEQKLASFN